MGTTCGGGFQGHGAMAAALILAEHSEPRRKMLSAISPEQLTEAIVETLQEEAARWLLMGSTLLPPDTIPLIVIIRGLLLMPVGLSRSPPKTL